MPIAPAPHEGAGPALRPVRVEPRNGCGTNIITKALVNNTNNRRRITLRNGGILASTRGMDMRSVALHIKAITQTGIQISDPPGLLDGHTGLFTLSSDETVHATIEVGK